MHERVHVCVHSCVKGCLVAEQLMYGIVFNSESGDLGPSPGSPCFVTLDKYVGFLQLQLFHLQTWAR